MGRITAQLNNLLLFDLFERNLHIFILSLICCLGQDCLFAKGLLADLAVIVLICQQELDKAYHERVLQLTFAHGFDDGLDKSPD